MLAGVTCCKAEHLKTVHMNLTHLTPLVHMYYHMIINNTFICYISPIKGLSYKQYSQWICSVGPHVIYCRS